jgi:hypothetical protein
MHKLAVMAAAALLALAARAEAAPILTIDQQSTIATGYGQLFRGQTFTPTLDRVDAFELVLSAADGASSTTVRLDLYAGAGFGGIPIASSAATFSGGFQTVHFVPGAALLPGAIYTVHFVRTGGAEFLVRMAEGNPYAGGTAYVGATPQPIFDLVFTEGLHTAVQTAIPEPASLALVLAGLAGLGLARRHRSCHPAPRLR